MCVCVLVSRLVNNQSSSQTLTLALVHTQMLPEDQQTGRLSIQEKVLAGRRELVKHMKSIRKQLMLHSCIPQHM